MHIRTSRVTRNGTTYEYHQLVESFRRPADGMPSCRVIATFNQDQALEVQNMRDALAAARKGKRVAVTRTSPALKADALKPTENLRYLDLAVLLELWREWRLDELLNELMPSGAERLQPAAVVAALSLQRCVDPGSTLYATRWLPRTALVELLKLDQKSFNNTRLHRTLDDLDSVTSALMSKLARRYEERDGVFASMFLDVSDAWFVGDGPSLAERGKTKEGMVRRKIGVVLLCNQHGYPLRWEVIPGNQNDSVAMHRMLRAVAGLSWAQEAPIVFDRAMGKTAHIVAALETGLRFVTALCVTEIDAYAPTLPHASFADLAPQEHQPREVEEAARRAQVAGMTKAADNLFVLDLGIVEWADASAEPEPGAARSATIEDATVRAIRLCRKVRQDVDDGRFASYASAGRAAGLSKSLTIKYLQLGRLSEQAQRDVLDGRASGCALAALLKVAAEPDVDARQSAFVALLAANAGKPSRSSARRSGAAPAATPIAKPKDPLRVRVVVFFNPDRFVEQRIGARKKLAGVETFVTKLNDKLATKSSKNTSADVAATVRQMLRTEAMFEAYDVHVDEPSPERPHLRVRLTLDQAEWARRRRYDGFCALIVHPEITDGAAELCRLYRAKDAVEKDFKVIKSVVEVRPVWHHTDAKVRAHVALCMLALLIERTLNRKLKGHATAEAALEELATCHLNLYAGKSGPPTYAITHPNHAQQAILRKLHLQQLADDLELADRISPRRSLPAPPP